VTADSDGYENGRGLLTVVASALTWGVEGDDAGRVVWAEIAFSSLPRN
jgi:hypothetical protein